MHSYIEVAERGTRTLPPATFELLGKHDSFASLIDDGILTTVRSRAAGTGIRAGAYVGSAHLEGFGTISVVPKISGAFKELVKWSVPRDIRESTAPSQVGRDSPILEQFVGRFLDSLAEYLSDGRLRQYSFRDRAGSIARGRLDVRKTFKLEARGKAGVLAYRERYLSPANDLNRFLAIALFAVEEYCASVGSRSHLPRVRAYASLFEDVDWRQFIAYPLSRTLDLHARAELLAQDTPAYTAVQYGRALLLHLGAWPTSGSTGVSVPHSFFLNLETLFEEAVRNILASAAEAVKGASLGIGMFTSIDGLYVANPDVYVEIGDRRVVLDVKYRDLKGGFPGHSAFYQLHSHAITLRASAMVLVYPLEIESQVPWTIRDFGLTRDGIYSFLVRIDVARLEEGVIGAWHDLRSALQPPS